MVYILIGDNGSVLIKFYEFSTWMFKPSRIFLLNSRDKNKTYLLSDFRSHWETDSVAQFNHPDWKLI